MVETASIWGFIEIIFYNCVFIFGGLECVGHSFAYVAHFVFFRDVWIRTQKAAVASRRATNLATHLPVEIISLCRCNRYYTKEGEDGKIYSSYSFLQRWKETPRSGSNISIIKDFIAYFEKSMYNQPEKVNYNYFKKLCYPKKTGIND